MGEEVLATDPETGETAVKWVEAVITATDGHPFWVPGLSEWVDAADLAVGQWLQTSAGTWVQITAVEHRTEATRVHNLTIADIHTYYVVAGNTPVLVHNANCGPGDPLDEARAARDSLAEEVGRSKPTVTGGRDPATGRVAAGCSSNRSAVLRTM
ncbi:polymorphic toxin-type HINT domain-containing protein [Micromonospora sp. LOL_014]|uniref:polymorphic toxin-type HINT domain-containing protein n=1 Tax=Micromonospora sp. LOL_014 TaxID=3345415 RepID=UPI003A85C4E2